MANKIKMIICEDCKYSSIYKMYGINKDKRAYACSNPKTKLKAAFLLSDCEHYDKKD